jgi:AAA+ ATPase superfamily predicted ATPase
MSYSIPNSGEIVDFKFGGPIEPWLFFNREKESRFLLSKLTQVEKGIRHNYSLVGPRRVGKSSILVFLENSIDKKNTIPVLIDCEGREITRERELTLDLFLNYWGGLVLDKYFEKGGFTGKIKIKLSNLASAAKDKVILSLSEILGQVKSLELRTVEEYLSLRIEFEKTTQKEKPDSKQLMKLFEDTLELAEKIGREKKLYWIVMLDEFQTTGKFKKPFDFLSAFRRHMEHQKNVVYLLTGSNVGMMEDILLRRPFGGHIPIEWIDSFDRETSIRFLKERFMALKRTVDEEAVAEIVSFAHGSPAFLNWFGEQCCREVEEGGQISIELVKKLKKKMFSYEGLAHVFDDELRKISPKKGKVFQTFVEMSVHDLSSPTRISEKVQGSTPSDVIVYLRRLESRGYVRRVEEGKYTVIDPVLKSYIKYKFQGYHKK